jgi:hypothetical protein
MMRKFHEKSPLFAFSNGKGASLAGSLADRYGLNRSDPWFPHPNNPLLGGIQPGNLNDGLAQITEMIAMLTINHVKQVLTFLGLQKEDKTHRGTRTVSAFRSFWPSLRTRTPNFPPGNPALLEPRPGLQLPVQRRRANPL